MKAFETRARGIMNGNVEFCDSIGSRQESRPQKRMMLTLNARQDF